MRKGNHSKRGQGNSTWYWPLKMQTISLWYRVRQLLAAIICPEDFKKNFYGSNKRNNCWCTHYTPRELIQDICYDAHAEARSLNDAIKVRNKRIKELERLLSDTILDKSAEENY